MEEHRVFYKTKGDGKSAKVILPINLSDKSLGICNYIPRERHNWEIKLDRMTVLKFNSVCDARTIYVHFGPYKICF